MYFIRIRKILKITNFENYKTILMIFMFLLRVINKAYMFFLSNSHIYLKDLNRNLFI